jgi:hypothetical protein
MNTAASASSIAVARPLPAILVGGGIAGALDLSSAYIAYGWNVPRGIAAGLLGPAARQGGLGVYILGIALHFLIAITAAAVYYFVSRKLTYIIEPWIVCGMFFGIAVWLVMNLIVLPLCAFHFRGPFALRGIIQGVLIHMFLIGVPIAYSVRRFSR